MIGVRARTVGLLVAMAAAVTLVACTAPSSKPSADGAARWVETQQQAPDLGVELPPMRPGLADEFEAVAEEPTSAAAVPGASGAVVPRQTGSIAKGVVPRPSRPVPTVTPTGAVRAPMPSYSPTMVPGPVVVPDPVLTSVPQSGTRTFAAASGGTDVVGDGSKLVTYRVEVEGGIPGWYPELFADRVDPILADTRSWRAGHTWSFKRVPAGTTPSLYIRLATPKTVDYFCNQYGIDTQSKYSCRYGKVVLINLMRWTNAVPGFGTDLLGYRRMVTNHEVGHFLGHDHVLCPGSGKLAPVMQTQTIALNGCKPNSWPYPDGVHYVTGPAA